MYFFAEIIANKYLNITETKLAIIALSPSVFLVAITSVFRGYFNGRELIKDAAKAQSYEQLVKTISTITLIELSVYMMKMESTEIMAAIANLGVTIGNIIELLYLYKKYKKHMPELKEEILSSVNSERIRIKVIIKELAKHSLPISLSAIILSISRSIDSVTIVDELKEIIGYENAKIEYGILSGKVESLINLPLSFNMAISGALLPTIVMNKNNLKQCKKRITNAVILEMLIALPITLMYIIYPNFVLHLLFPNASSGGAILRISAFLIPFLTLESTITVILNGTGNIYAPIKATLAGAIIKYILNKLLIKNVNFIFWGTEGAAIATLACHIITFAILLFEIAYQYKNNKN